MKIAFTSIGKDLISHLDLRFGRAPYLVIVDLETMDYEVIDNTMNAVSLHDAGVRAAKALAERGVDILIVGHCGPNAFRALQEGGIKVMTGAEGRIMDAVVQFKQGRLQAIEDADVWDHWIHGRTA